MFLSYEGCGDIGYLTRVIRHSVESMVFLEMEGGSPERVCNAVCLARGLSVNYGLL